MATLKSSLAAHHRSLARAVRGRPPKKAFINVLVRTSTRAALTQLKGSLGLASQGEVIDHLIENTLGRSADVAAGRSATRG
jgi:hypothetical protein